MKKKTGKQRGILAKLLHSIVLLGILLALAVSLVSYSSLTHVITWQYDDNASSIGYTAGAYLDPAWIRSFNPDNPTDEYYDSIRVSLENLCEKTDTESIFVARPDPEDEDSMMYLFHAVDPRCTVEPHSPGDIGPIPGRSSFYIFPWLEDLLGNYYINFRNFSLDSHKTVLVSLEDETGSTYALVGVELTVTVLNQARIGYVGIIALVTILIVALFLVISVWVLNKNLLQPITTIKNEAEDFIRRDARVSEVLGGIDTGDEIGDLAQAIHRMELDTHAYIDHLTHITSEQQKMGAELDIAHHIQSSLLPSVFPPFPDHDEFEIYASMTPAKEVGGDFYDMFLIDDSHVAVVMADVSGKGVPAAMLMMVTMTLIRSAARSGLTPGRVMEKVNNQLCENNRAEMFVTAWLGVLDLPTGNLTCANAGHEYPIVMDDSGFFSLYKDRHSLVLGGLANTRYREYTMHLSPGDRLFVYTDGVTEATNSSLELFGTDRLVASLNRHRDGSCEEVLRSLKADIDAFVGDAPQFDDITMLCLTMNRHAGAKDVRISVEPKLEEIDKIVTFLESTLEEFEPPVRVMSQLGMSADEVFSNIVYYSGATNVTVSCLAEPNMVTLRFYDNGRPYNPTLSPAPDVTLPLEKRKVGGLGIMLVKKSMDSVSYACRNNQNILTLQKRW